MHPDGPVLEASIEIEGIHVHWDPRSRHAFVEYKRGCRPTGAVADVLTRALADWVGNSLPFVVIADCTGAAASTLVWRLDWARTLRAYGVRVRMALFNVDADTSALVTLFRPAAGIDIQVFRDRDAAEAWARQR